MLAFYLHHHNQYGIKKKIVSLETVYIVFMSVPPNMSRGSEFYVTQQMKQCKYGGMVIYKHNSAAESTA